MRYCVTLLLIIASATSVRGQTSDSPRVVASALRDAAAKNRIVRIHIASDILTGRVFVQSDSLFRVDRKSVVPSAVSSLEVRFSQPDRLLNGFLIGAGVGAVTLGPAGVEFAESLGEHRLTTWEKISTVLIGAAFGSLIGVAVDAAREAPPIWSPVYPPSR